MVCLFSTWHCSKHYIYAYFLLTVTLWGTILMKKLCHRVWISSPSLHRWSSCRAGGFKPRQCGTPLAILPQAAATGKGQGPQSRILVLMAKRMDARDKIYRCFLMAQPWQREKEDSWGDFRPKVPHSGFHPYPLTTASRRWKSQGAKREKEKSNNQRMDKIQI